MFGEKNNILKRISLGIWVIVAFLGFYILYIGSAIFLPLIIAIFLLILFTAIYSFFYNFIGRKYISIALSLGLFFGFFAIVGYIINTQIGSFAENTDKFREGFWNIFAALEAFLMGTFGIDIKQYLNVAELQNYLAKVDYAALSGGFFGTVTNLVSSIGTTIILLAFILVERDAFIKKSQYIFDVNGFDKFSDIMKKIYEDLNTYFVSKFFIALLNAIIAAVIMSLFGLDFALTFGLIVFIFDFIPVIGGIIALGLPFLYSLVTFGSLPMSLAMLLCMNIPQFLSGNFIEPKIMGDRLNLSSFFLIVSLLFWGMFWGVLGAFLATPIMATMNIILAKFETTRPIAILLSKNGNVE